MRWGFTNVFLLAISTVAFAAAPFPDGFAGIPWGSSMEVAKAAMLRREGVAINDMEIPGLTPEQRRLQVNYLRFTGGAFGSHKQAYWSLWFVGNQLAKGEVYFVHSNPPNRDILGEYQDLFSELTAKYGNIARTLNIQRDVVTFWDFTIPEKELLANRTLMFPRFGKGDATYDFLASTMIKMVTDQISIGLRDNQVLTVEYRDGILNQIDAQLLDQPQQQDNADY